MESGIKINIPKQKSASSLLLGIAFFAYTMPMYLWHATLIYYFIVILSILIMIRYMNIHALRRSWFTVLVPAVFLYLSLAMGENIISNILRISIFPLFFIDRDKAKDSFEIFYNIYTFFVFMAIISYFLYHVGIPMPHITIQSANINKSWTMEAYPFLTVANSSALSAFRFHAIFEEPGNVGTTAILLLGITGLDVKDKRTWINVLGGLLSLSLFFYVGFILLLYFYVIKKRGNSNTKLIIVIVAIILLVLTFSKGTILNNYIGSRLQINWTDFSFSGNNRANSRLIMYFDEIKWKSPVFYLGAVLSGENLMTINQLTSGSSGYRNAIINFGLIGCILYIALISLFAWRHISNKKEFLCFMIVFILILYQRPYFFDRSFLCLFLIWIFSREHTEINSWT
jgi:hypothetical protein